MNGTATSWALFIVHRSSFLSSSRELDLEARSARLVVVHVNLAVVVANDAMHDGQAKAGAAAFRREVREEKLVLVGVRNASTGIGDLDVDAVRRATRGDPDFTGLRSLYRVLQQIADGAFDLFRIHQQLE